MAIVIGEELANRGFLVNYAIQKPIFQIPHEIESERIHILNKKKDSGKYYHHLNNVIQIKRLAKKFKPDVVIGLTYFSSFLSCFTLCNNIIGTFDVNPYALGKKRHRIADFVCRWPKVKNIVGPSKGTIMELKEARPRFSEKFITIYNSLDFEKVENLANEDIQESYLIQKPYLSAMGRLSDQKNFTMLISSYAKSNINEIYNLAIIGDGPKKEKLEKQIKKLGLESKVFLIGFKSNPYPYIQQSEFFINTSSFESFCVVILEALALGKMVVATDCPSGPGELVQHGYNGYLTEVNNIKSLVNRLNHLSNNPHIIKEKGLIAKKSVDKFRVDAIGNKWEELIIKVINKYN
ncbi:glycosyl transferase, group 1 family [Christiangramia flava JLT2011]|uniref:Glycosyl transferase, group 1 n=2 Tax=Christiangramia TaxID=292691 RepID=A0A1L7HZP8_9FLAO|nr:Glycosyl transferase, group 1 [Christiangramia flava JLT2011]OSS38455.1 glycosyl transferase, group 1 family [Christiangramia flava JLT2011]